ncbi:hypothetical protein V6N12_059918 [Hibiscus sabdariffa]|uniref:RNase H type-1 domain-containing protein n=1 Tax=Hibiscus sabdariffa TaxID=183260 RepID=A0ABR2D2W7_9ROSI
MEHKPCFAFLQETKLSELYPVVCRKLLFSQGVEIVFSPSIGHFKILKTDCGFLNIYCPSVEAEKGQCFAEVTEFLEKKKQPWCVCGDFNVYLHPREKCGGPVTVAAMEVFRRFIKESCLANITLKGGEYKWSNGRDPPTLVRLDRFLVNANFLSAFHHIEQCLLSKSISDHNAISLILDYRNWGPKPFKFFNYHLEEEGFVEMVLSCIQKKKGSRRRRGVLHLLNDVKGAIKDWTASRCITPAKSIKALESEIHELELKQCHGSCNPLLPRNLAKTRAASWFKARWPDSNCSIDAVISDPSLTDSCSFTRNNPSVKFAWEGPPFGFVKMNVDGAMVSDGSKGGIGGILCNSMGICLASFSLPIGPGLAILAELEAIKYGLDWFFSCRESHGFRLILESNCSTALEWISNPTLCPSAFGSLVISCKAWIDAHGVITRLISRSINIEAARLAKEAVG